MKEIDEAKTIDVVQVAERLGIVVAERTRSGLCPFHEERTPSFRLRTNNRYHCFGCGADGDVVDLVGKLLGLKPVEAATWITGETSAKPVLAKAAEPEPERYIHPFVYEEAWQASERGDFLAYKGLDSNQFGIRRCTVRTAEIISDFKPGGLFIPYYQNGYITYARWRNADPKAPARNKFRGPSGVTLKLYGQDSVPVMGHELYITESETDQMSLATLGYAAVAFPGAAGVINNGLLRHYMAMMSHRKVDELVLAFDGDAAGRKADTKFREFIADVRVTTPVRTFGLEGHKDVNEWYQDGLR